VPHTTQIYTKIRPPQLKRPVAFYDDQAERLLSVEALPAAPKVRGRSVRVRGTFECSRRADGSAVTPVLV
jgi:hypothetical protein